MPNTKSSTNLPTCADNCIHTVLSLGPCHQIVLCNRAASYMAINKPIPALADAQRAAACDTTNWKAHWRTGLSLMMMAPRLERSEQAIAAFERTCACPTLPDSEKQNAKEALNRAKYRLEQGKDALDMPDMANCVIS